MPENAGRILVVTDSPDYYSTRDMGKLYPGRVDEHDLTETPVTAEVLAPYEYVWTLTRRAENRDLMDYAAVREHARSTGARVVSHLYEYAHGSGLEFRFRDAGSKRPKIEVVAESDPVTRGFSAGDKIYWYRNSSDIDDPSVAHYAYREVVCDDDPGSGRRVLARSCETGGAVWVEERFDSGGVILACDLYSPIDLALTQGDPWILHRGTFSKYIPAGNLFGETVCYGRYQDRKLTVEELIERIRSYAERPGVEVRDEGASSEGTPVLSVRFGNPEGARFLLMSVKHGMEWENVYASLVTLDRLLEGDVIDLERFSVVAVPLLNPYGYREGVRHNASGVDLNRQLRDDWETFRGWTDEVLEPWTFDFKGHEPAAEAEAVIEQRLRQEPGLLCVIDAHAMAGPPVLMGSGPDADVVVALAAEIVEDLKDRYLVRYLDDAAPRQLTIESYPGMPGEGGTWKRSVTETPHYHIVYENTGQLPDVHATVMQTDLGAGTNLTAMRRIAESVKG